MQFGPGFLPTFLYYFSGTAVVFALVVLKSTGLGLDTGFPQQIGLLGGVAAGLLGGYFNRTITFSLPLSQQKKVKQQLNDALSKMGYEQKETIDDVVVYERSQLSKFFSGKIYVQLEKDTATIAGRAVQIRTLKKVLEQS